MDKINLSIVTPNGAIFNEDVKSVLLPGKDGEFGILPHHSSLVTSLKVGVIEIVKLDSSIEAVAINWGHVKVTETSVDILLDSAIALNPSDSSVLSKNIEAARKLVASVEEDNECSAAVNAKISSYK
jgi:F-type H+-transporting ATPase subunit epsilon